MIPYETRNLPSFDCFNITEKDFTRNTLFLAANKKLTNTSSHDNDTQCDRN